MTGAWRNQRVPTKVPTSRAINCAGISLAGRPRQRNPTKIVGIATATASRLACTNWPGRAMVAPIRPPPVAAKPKMVEICDVISKIPAAVRAIASYRVRHNKRCKVLVSQMSATVYYRLSADASLGYRRNGRSQSSPPAFSSNEIPFPISAGCYSAKLNLDAIALRQR